jgi:hypothetical protein
MATEIARGESGPVTEVIVALQRQAGSYSIFDVTLRFANGDAWTHARESMTPGDELRLLVPCRA